MFCPQLVENRLCHTICTISKISISFFDSKIFIKIYLQTQHPLFGSILRLILLILFLHSLHSRIRQTFDTSTYVLYLCLYIYLKIDWASNRQTMCIGQRENRYFLFVLLFVAINWLAFSFFQISLIHQLAPRTVFGLAIWNFSFFLTLIF